MIDLYEMRWCDDGRGALSMPWIFRDTHSYLTRGVGSPAADDVENAISCDAFANSCVSAASALQAGIAQADQLVRKNMTPAECSRANANGSLRRRNFCKSLESIVDWRLRTIEQVAAGRIQAPRWSNA